MNCWLYTSPPNDGYYVEHPCRNGMATTKISHTDEKLNFRSVHKKNYNQQGYQISRLGTLVATRQRFSRQVQLILGSWIRQ